MSRRIDVELTSSRPDGSWTWRAAGARQPKGDLDGSILYPGAKVGDVVRAEADFDVDGITILSVAPPAVKARKEPERIEIIGSPKSFEPVTSTLVPKSERGRGERRDRGDRGDRPARSGGRPDSGGRAGGAARGDTTRGERGDRGARPSGAPGAPRSERPARGDRPDRPRRDGERRPARPTPEAAEPKPKAKRLNPATTHRDAVLATLSPEEQPVAQQVLRGGIPAVRQAVEQQNAAAKAEGRAETIKPDALVAMAEQLLPRLKVAEWRDRAEAAAADVDEISLRDLRSVVTGSDVARDDDTRALAQSLREALERRTNEQRERWVTEVKTALDDNRVVRALRISSRPPDPTSRFPADLALRLTEAASAAMTADILPDRWTTLLEAVAASPVRRSVKPAGFPAEPGEALLQAARQASGRVPALASLLGIAMPPPPGPMRKPPRPPRPAPSAPRQSGQQAAPESAQPAAAETGPAVPPAPESAVLPAPEPAVTPPAPESAPATPPASAPAASAPGEPAPAEPPVAVTDEQPEA